MLYEISRELDAALQLQGVPFRVVYGPERAPAATSLGRIVIDHGGERVDTFEPAKGTKPVDKSRGVRRQGAKLRIYAQNTSSGARVTDHRRLAEHVLDRVFCELDILIQRRRNAWAMGSGGFLLPEDLAQSETWPGAIYEASFWVDRALTRVDWTGAGRPTVEIEGVGPHDPPGTGGLNILNTTEEL